MQAVLYGPTGLLLNPPVAVVIDPTAAAMRLSLKPLEYAYPGSLGGHYRITIPMTGGLTAIGAGGVLLGFRWAPTTPGLLAVIKRIGASTGVKTIGSTAYAVALDACKATGYSAQYSSGGTAATLAAVQKTRSSMGNSQAAIYYANSTTVISTVTNTLDTLAFGIWHFDNQPVTTGVVRAGAPNDLYKEDTQGAHAVVLTANEGFVVRNVAAFGTSAVQDVFITIEWAEVQQY